MSTFLTTRKMAPALVARVEASVGARRSGSGRAGRVLRRIALVVIVVALGYVAAAAVRLRALENRELEASRAALLDRVRAADASLGPDAPVFMARVAPWLVSLAERAYAGDLVEGELRSAEGWERALGGAAVYVRGPLGGFMTPAAIAETALGSKKDALAVCLVDPPAARTERAVLAKLRAATAPNLRRLGDVELALRDLRAPWAERARAADDPKQIDALSRELARVPIEEARRAAGAALLVAVMDEPDEGGPTELDGERPHAVRVGVVDLRAGRVILRARRRVDPAWLSDVTRITRASAADGCALAFDVRAAAVRP